MPERFLAVELADIGDLILITPALAALRETYPEARIDVLTTEHAAPILSGTGLADEVILFNKFAFDHPKNLIKPGNLRAALALARRLRRGHYDTVLIFHHLTTRFGAAKYAALAFAAGAKRRVGLDNGKGWFLTDRVIDQGFGAQHQVRYWLEVAALVGASTTDERLHIGISEADHAWAAAHLPIEQAKRLIAIHPGSGGYSLARRWEADKFAALADRLVDECGAQIVIVGGTNDDAAEMIGTMRHAPINLTGQTTLNQLAAVLARCERFYGADSGVMHIAAASGTQVTALYGPSNHEAWHPWSPTARVVRTGVRCSPCSYVGNTVGLREGCAARTCMRTLTVEDVFSLTSDSPSPQVERGQGGEANILGIPIRAITFAALLDQIGEWVKGDVPRQICTVNPEFVMSAQNDIHFYNILKRADLCIPDGVGLLWAAKRLGKPLPERVTGSDGVPLIAERAARKGWKLFFLGAAPGVAARAAEVLTARYPTLQVVGAFAGSPAPHEEDALIERINQSGADILFVAYGAPNQDKWIARNLPRLRPRVSMGVGGAFDFVTGVARRAPRGMQRLGLEWLHRLIHQPWRWRRMLRLPRFVIAVVLRGARGPSRFEVLHPGQSIIIDRRG